MSKRCSVATVGLVVSLMSAIGLPRANADESDRSVEEWIRAWDANSFQQSQKAKASLAKIGEPAVLPLTRLIRENHQHAGYAIKTLAEMGSVARPALSELLKLARNKAAKDPDGWTWNVPIRTILFMSLGKMTWASEELMPVLEHVGNDAEEAENIRRVAVNALRGMGPDALPVLQEFAKSGSDGVRRSAVGAIVEIQEKAGKPRATTLQEIVESHPLDPNVPNYLADMKRIFNLGQIHPPTQRVKQIYRRELDKKPDPQIAWLLATIIRNGLAGSELKWSAPSDSYSRRRNREDPAESHETLASALTIAFEHSKPDTELRKKAGLSLAKLRLLQGDWSGMNDMLVRVGQEPVPADRRTLLPPPPLNWDNLKQDWQPADEAVRTGKCGIAFRFVRRGRPLQGIQGVHVLVKKQPPPQRGFGIRADTLLYATQPMLEGPFDSFGYRGQDRNQCRYGVTNKNGFVRIDGLPKTPALVEVLIPTANFAEAGNTWDLLMETSGALQIADRSDPHSVDANKPPAVIELEEGEVIRYPVMFVRPQVSANVEDWDQVSDDFELTWNGPQQARVDHYNVKLSVSAPMQHPGIPTLTPSIVTESVQVKEPSWALGKRGVGKLRLVPGNMYLLGIDAVSNGDVVASLPRCRIWVAWKHRKTDPPLTGLSSSRPAFYHDIWLRTNANGKSLEERLPALISGSPQMFETEYHRLGMAWLDLHKSKANAAVDLRKLVKELPVGNVVRTTAESLLDASANGEQIPKRLKFVAPRLASGLRE